MTPFEHARNVFAVIGLLYVSWRIVSYLWPRVTKWTKRRKPDAEDTRPEDACAEEGWGSFAYNPRQEKK